MGKQERMDELERLHRVNIDIHDGANYTTVYRYTDEGVGIRVDFPGMSPPIDQVEVAAAGIAELAGKLK